MLLGVKALVEVLGVEVAILLLLSLQLLLVLVWIDDGDQRLLLGVLIHYRLVLESLILL
jgi:hypothetical protein